jgi:hypothetical protein
MIIALFLSVSMGAAHQASPAATAQDPKLIRVQVQTDEGGDPTELAARRESVKHLLAAIADKKKAGLVAVTEASDNADVVVEVEERGVTVPKVVIGLSGGMGSPGGRPGPGAQQIRVAQLRVTFQIAGEHEPTAVTNKNRVNENESGWKSAAEDVVKQLEKWITEHRAAILEARGRRF